MYILYEHVNKQNQKRYIGITSKTLEERSGSNGRRYYDSPKFWKAIQKYGWDNFEHNVILSQL